MEFSIKSARSVRGTATDIYVMYTGGLGTADDYKDLCGFYMTCLSAASATRGRRGVCPSKHEPCMGWF